jgi:hypothetical protein
MINDKTSVSSINELLSDKLEKGIPELLKGMTNEQLMKVFYSIQSSPEETQRCVLQDILRFARNSEIGFKFGFSEISSIEDYRKRVPVSNYSSYEAYIEKLRLGQDNILYDGATASFIATSGSTGVPKLIPESKNGERVKSLVSRIRSILLLMMAPEVMIPGRKILTITNASEYGKTDAGIPIGSASGQAAKDSPAELREKMVLPLELIMATDLSNDATDYLTLRYALEEKELGGVVCSNIAHFNILLKKMNGMADELICDIEQGQISLKIDMDPSLRESLLSRIQANPQRSQELKNILHQNHRLDVAAIWPNFSVVSCWMSASSGRIVADIRKNLPSSVKFLEWGYGASEGKFNIPDKPQDPAGLLALFGFFFEFIPIGTTGPNKGEPLLVHELKPGEYYELIITSYSGLYRYNMKDIVYVKEMNQGAPRIVFVSKASEKICRDNVELMLFEIDECVNGTSEKLRSGIRFYQILFDDKNKKLIFVIEPESRHFQGELFRDELEQSLLCKNKGYAANRSKDKWSGLDVLIMKDGYRDSLFIRSVMPGKNVNQTKLKTIIDDYPDHTSVSEWVKEG